MTAKNLRVRRVVAVEEFLTTENTEDTEIFLILRDLRAFRGEILFLLFLKPAQDYRL